MLNKSVDRWITKFGKTAFDSAFCVAANEVRHFLHQEQCPLVCQLLRSTFQCCQLTANDASLLGGHSIKGKRFNLYFIAYLERSWVVHPFLNSGETLQQFSQTREVTAEGVRGGW